MNINTTQVRCFKYGFGQQQAIGDHDGDVGAVTGEFGLAAQNYVGEAGKEQKVKAQVRIDTPNEMKYFRSGGILPFVLDRLARS